MKKTAYKFVDTIIQEQGIQNEVPQKLSTSISSLETECVYEVVFKNSQGQFISYKEMLDKRKKTSQSQQINLIDELTNSKVYEQNSHILIHIIKKETMIKQNQQAFKEVYKQQKEPLGSGGFGTVYKCRHRQSQQTRAVKVVPKKKIKNMQTFLQEIEILKKLDHPNVLRVYEYFIDD